MIVKVDKEDFVISVEKEAVDSAMREINRSDFMPEATRICKGPWHYKGGKGTVLPISAFPENRYRKGTLTKTCGECLEKSGKRSLVPFGVKAEPVVMNKVEEVRIPVLPRNPANGGLQHKWEITYITTTTTTVYAKTYAEAGESVGDVEVTNVRRLD